MICAPLQRMSLSKPMRFYATVSTGAQVHTLAKQGRLEEAMKHYNYKPDPMGASSIIARVNDIDTIFKVYRTLITKSAPNAFVINAMSSACGRTKHPQRALDLLDDVVKNNIILDNNSFGKMTFFCAELGDLHYAKRLFKIARNGNSKCNVCNHFHIITIVQNVISFNQLIRTMTQRRSMDDAMDVFRYIISHKIAPDEYTYSMLLSGCANVNQLLLGNEVISYIKNQGVKQSVIIKTAIIKLYMKSGHVEKGMEIFRQLVNEKQKFGEKTLVTVLSGCANVSNLQFGLEVLAFAVSAGLAQTAPFQNNLIQLYLNCQHLDKARSVFQQMVRTGPKPDDYTLSIVLSGCATDTDFGELVYAYIVENNIRHSLIVTNSLMRFFTTSRKMVQAMNLFDEMLINGLLPDETTFVTILTGCSNTNTLEYGILVHNYIIANHVTVTLPISNALVRMYTGCGDLASSMKVFDSMLRCNGPRPDKFTCSILLTAAANVKDIKMGEKVHEYVRQAAITLDVVLQTTLIQLYSQCDRFDTALSIFKNMIDVGPRPNEYTCMVLLSALADSASLEAGKLVHHYIYSKLNKSVKALTALIYFYARCGAPEVSLSVFRDIQKGANVITWHTIILAYALNGNANQAIALFEEMIESDVVPDEMTISCVLNACSHGGLVEKAKQIFASIETFGIRANIHHYTCMIDTLARAQNFDEAESVAKQIENQSVIPWISLARAYHTHHQVERAEHVSKIIMKMDPANAAPYVLMANICDSK
jgi:pentatricopeptide repeat protein